jgi:hypothetical protein
LLGSPALATRVFEHWGGRALTGAAAFVMAGSVAGSALAQEQAQPTTFDPGHGPITGSTRYVGMGGAFVAIADDTEGVAINPAADAVRLPYSWHDFDFGFGLDVSIGAWLPKNDIYNQGSSNSGKSSAFFGSLAAVVNYKHLGFGLAAEAQRNAATREDDTQGITPTSLSANFGIVHASVAYGYLDGQLLVGAGPRMVGTSLGGSSGLFSAAGVGYEAGFIVKPIATQYRLAAAVKSPIDATVPGTSNTVHVPWELAFGVAYQFGARPLNPRFISEEHVARRMSGSDDPSDAELEAAEDDLFERYQRRQRFYLLVSSQLSVVQGASQLGVAQDDAGRTPPVFSPRLGLESEVIPHILKLRAGSYYEPARMDDTTGRVHGTGGFDVRLFEWNVFGLIKRFDYWKLSVGADAARSYLNTSFTIGFWH